MANSGVNAGCAKCFILFMAIVILLQGVVYLGLAIFGVIESDCSDQNADITSNPFKFAVDLIYFAKEECGPPSITIMGRPISLDINWSESFNITNRAYIFMIVYMVVSALWILTSLLVIVTLCASVTNLILGLCYWPWFLSVIAGSILDAAATGFFINDIVHTTSANETLSYIGAQNVPEELLTYLQSFDAYFITPALVMTLVSSRVVLVWLLNIFGTSFCLSFSRTLAKRNEAHKKEERPPTNNESQHRPVPAQVTREPAQWEQPQQPIQQVEVVEQYPPQIRPKPLPILITGNPPQRQNSMPYNNNPQAERVPYDAIQSQTPVMVYPLTAPSPNDSAGNARPNEFNRQPSAGGEVLTYRSTATHPDKLDYPAAQAQAQSPSPTPIEMRVSSPQLSVVSPLNNRYSTMETAPFPNQPQRVSDELRSQLPWSYTSMLGGKPQPPRKPQKMYPQIPEPDYTTHPANTERPPTTGGDAGAAQQSQPGYSRW